MSWALAAALATIPLALAVSRSVSLSLALPTHPGTLKEALPRSHAAVRRWTRALVTRLSGDPLSPLLTALCLPDGQNRDAEINEALDDLDRRLGRHSFQAAAYLRVYAFGGVFVCTLAVLVGGESADSLMTDGLPMAAMIAVAAWSYWLVERRSSQTTATIRADLDALVELVLSRTGAPPELFSRDEPRNRGGNQPHRGRRLRQ